MIYIKSTSLPKLTDYDPSRKKVRGFKRRRRQFSRAIESLTEASLEHFGLPYIEVTHPGDKRLNNK
jgi:hypothetical protein